MLKVCRDSGLAWLWITLLIVFIDHFSKWWAINHLVYQTPYPVFPGLDFTLVFNRGAAFSFLHSASGWQNILLGFLAIVVSAMIFICLARSVRANRFYNIGLCLIMGGALGNVWDRISYGYVIDFISFYISQWHFAIFNLADAAISIGAVILFIQWCFLEKH